jgi:hypothetical protein
MNDELDDKGVSESSDALFEGGVLSASPALLPQRADPEDTHRSNIAYVLIALLALVVVGHYVCVTWMAWNGKNTDSTNAAFNAALPVISGLTGSAVTYYFTRRK